MKGYDLLEVLQEVDPKDLDYNEWSQVGMALKEEGYTANDWDQWSKNDPRYKSGECFKKWMSFGDYTGERVTGGSIVQIAKDHGWRSPRDSREVFGWNDTIDANAAWRTTYKVVDDPAWLEIVQIEEPDAEQWDPKAQVKEYLETLFKPDERVGYVLDAVQDQDGRWRPAGIGSYRRTAGELLKELASERPLNRILGDYEEGAGGWIRFNPLDGGGVGNANVAAYRYALVESDTLDIEKQYALIKELQLPVSLLVHSGGKSLHAIVKVDAANSQEYREKVDYLYKVCEENGLDLDTQNKNPSRLSRLPGLTRNGKKQYIVAKGLGKETYDEWQEWVTELNDNLPDPESLDEVWDHMPDLAPPLIEGVLRQGHKMLIAGPSKAGKSFALIQLAIAIGEGKKWLEFQCAQGRVLYVNLELDRASALHRFKDVYKAIGLEPKNINNIDIWNLRGKSAPLDKLAPKLIRRAKEKDYIAVIIDPIYKVITGDENSADEMAHFTNQFDLIATELGSAVIFCHHHSKGYQGGKRAMDRASGSGVFARDPDALLDMVELELNQGVKEKAKMDERTRLLGVLVEKFNPNYFKYKINQDDLWNPQEMEMHLAQALTGEEMLQAESIIAQELEDLRHRTAWRIEGTLREFRAFDPIDIWFSYPRHIVDHTGLLKDLEPEYEKAPWQRAREAQKTPEERSAQRVNELEIAYEALRMEDPDKPITLADLADKMNVVQKTVKNRIKEHGGFELDYQGFGKAAHVIRVEDEEA